MTTISKPLVVAGFASASESAVYTAGPGTRTIIDKITVYNGTANPVLMTFKLVPNGGTAGASNVMVSKSVASGATENFSEIVGQTLESGGFISELAGTGAALVRRITGREVT